jgi:hypothetical protein
MIPGLPRAHQSCVGSLARQLQQGDADFTDVVEDDVFQAKVIVTGPQSYETTLGVEITAPVLQVNSPNSSRVGRWPRTR